MAALVWIAANLRAVLAAYVALQFMDGCRLGPTHDVQRDRLMGVAAKAFDFEIKITGADARIEPP
jgi:hypothetical protein